MFKLRVFGFLDWGCLIWLRLQAEGPEHGPSTALTRRRRLALPLGVLHHLLGYALRVALLPLLLDELLKFSLAGGDPDLVSGRQDCATYNRNHGLLTGDVCRF